MIKIIPMGKVDEDFSRKITRWADEVIGSAETEADAGTIALFLWEREKDFLEFDAREKAELGVVTGGETDFLATHEAWRGTPRIHLALYKIGGIPEAVARGVVQHEIAHALLHGRPEFYRFRFSDPLLEAARSAGLDFTMLQQLIFLLSVAIKDEEVVRLLGDRGLGDGQANLLAYLMEDTADEQQTWEWIRNQPVLPLFGMAAFLKIRLPIETLGESGFPGSSSLEKQWEQAYSWLTGREKGVLAAVSQFVIRQAGSPFQERLERSTLFWISI